MACRRTFFWTVFLLLCLLGLLRRNVFSNELSKFCDAMYYLGSAGWSQGFFASEPDPSRRQWLFQMLMGPVLKTGGFLAASVIGRLAVYLLLAGGLTAVARALGLRLVFALPAIVLMDQFYSLAAGEWITRGVEPKVFSYGLVLLALASLLRRDRTPVWWAFLLGLAVSFHVLVGLYATLVFAAVVALFRREGPIGWRTIGCAAAVFLLAGTAGWIPAFHHIHGRSLTAAAVGAPLCPSYIYVYLRDAHHLDPGNWPPVWRLRLAVFMFVLFFSWRVVRLASLRDNTPDRIAAASRLLAFAVISMVPFAAGLLVAPFDPQGKILQYYLFRFGDVLLPLGTYFLAALALQVGPSGRNASRVGAAMRVVVAAGFVVLGAVFVRQAWLLREYPGRAQGVSPAWKECTGWVRQNTPTDALFIVSPLRTETFPWLAHRRLLGTFKQFNMSGGLVEWQRRMSALAGTEEPWPAGGWRGAVWLQQRYFQLGTEPVRRLLETYDASYFVTVSNHRLDLPVVFSNSQFTVYGDPGREGVP